MISKVLKVATASAFALMLGVPAYAEPDLTCQAGSGVWQAGSGIALDGALCAKSDGEYDFYRFDFAASKGQFAPAIPNLQGDLRYLFAANQVIFYADDATVYAVEREHFNVIWHKPWLQAQRIPADSADSGHFGVWTKGENGSEIHLLRVANGQILEEMTAKLGAEEPLKIVWQAKRLVVIEKERLTFWPRPGVPLPADPNNPGTEPPTPSDWKGAPVVVDIDPALSANDYVLDPNGLMVLNRPAKKLSYYRFNSQTWTTARINATALIHALGEGPDYAMAVTNDMNTVRVVARLGSFLQNRFEAKYWKLPRNPEDITVVGQQDIAALDGGTDNRVQTIDTTEMTWKRLALIEYASPGRIAELQNDELISIHPTGQEAVVIWNARTGAKISAIDAEKLADFGPVASVRTVPGMKRYKLLRSQSGMFVIYDTVGRTLSAPMPFEETAWSDMPRAIELLPDAMIISTGDASGARWDVYPADEKSAVSHLSAGSMGAFGELQTARQKWYGYCVSGDDCFKSEMTVNHQDTKTPAVKTVDDTVSHMPSPISWILCALAFFAMFAVMLWRRGFGRKSLLNANVPEDDDGMTPTDIFDDKNRRYITDRDSRFFLAPHWSSTPLFRVMFSILLGPAVGFAVAAHVFFDDTFAVFISWIIVLGMPVSAITWIATSWMYWNRYYLLRFGCITEGKWINCAQTNPSIVYEPVKGKTYELSKNQWNRVDFVPMILFDPARPEFAIQYTGVVSHSVVAHGDLSASPLPASVFDIKRIAGVLGLLAVTLVSTQLLFQRAYPNPLSAWRLDSIANDVRNDPESGTFAMACLGYCDDHDDDCFRQCHQRQLRIVFTQAGIPMPADPVMTPAEFLDGYREVIAHARSIALEQPELSCAERENQLANISLWPESVSEAFWQTYADVDTFYAAGLDEIYQSMKNDAAHFSALCDNAGACTKDASKCPEPPQCAGRITALKNRICAFDRALDIPDIDLNTYNMDE